MGTRSFVSLPSLNLGYANSVVAATPADLASIPTLGPVTEGGYLNGQTAFVVAMDGSGPGQYVLQAAISSAPDNYFVIPTPDDPTRQWVFNLIQNQGSLFAYSQEIDLTQVQTLTLLPPLGYRYQAIQVPQWSVTQLNGSVTSGPTTQLGTNAAINDIATSTVQSNLVAGPVNLTVAMQGTTTTPGNLDLSSRGVRLQITVGAVLNTATVFKAKLKIPAGLTRL